MKAVIFLLIIFLTAILQGTIFNALSLQGIKPDFPLILSCGVGLYKGEMKGLFFGGIIGLLMDSSTGLLLGPNITSKATIGFLSGFLRGKVFRMTAVLYFLFLFVLSLLDGVMNFLTINIFIVSSSFTESFSTLIFPQTVYNSIAGTIILTLFERLRLRYDREPSGK